VRKGKVYLIDLAKENDLPQFVADGDGVAVHPKSGKLLIQHFKKDGVRLDYLPATGGPPDAVPVQEESWFWQVAMELAPYPLGARAIHADGRVLVPVTSPESWFWRVAILEKDGTLTPIPLTYDGEIYQAVWAEGEGDKALGMGFPFRCELWRIGPRKKAD
jgi:hypothetical protein